MQSIAPVQTGMWASAFQRGKVAAQKNIIPGIIIWIIASIVISLWYFNESAQSFMLHIVEVKNTAPYTFAFISTAIAGALIPGIVMGIWSLHPRAWQQMPWLLLFYGLKGVEINALYQIQAYLFGQGADWQTLTIKSFVDQCIYVPVIDVASVAIAYAWIEGGRPGLRHSLRDNWWCNYWFPILFTNTIVWTPVVFLLYMLPTPLQLPLQNLVLCFWSLLVAVIANRNEGS